MTCKEIYLAALRKFGDVAEEGRSEDYAERAPYILANVIADLSTLNGQYCAMQGRTATPFAGVRIELEDEFPLCDRFAGAVSDHLAAMLTVDEDGELSDTFFDKFCTAVAAITAEIPAERQKILDVYGE